MIYSHPRKIEEINEPSVQWVKIIGLKTIIINLFWHIGFRPRQFRASMNLPYGTSLGIPLHFRTFMKYFLAVEEIYSSIDLVLKMWDSVLVWASWFHNSFLLNKDQKFFSYVSGLSMWKSSIWILLLLFLNGKCFQIDVMHCQYCI